MFYKAFSFFQIDKGLKAEEVLVEIVQDNLLVVVSK